MGAVKRIWPWIACIAADLVVAVIMWTLGYNYGKQSASKSNADTTVSKTEIVTTSKHVKPAPSNERHIGTVSVPIKMELRDPDEPQDLPENTILIFTPEKYKSDTLSETHDTALKDTLRAVVPLTQKEYRDSNFTAYVSGFMPKLDSIEVRSKVVTYTKTVTKYHTFNIGLTGGLGYGVFNKKPDVFIGVGVTWNLFSK